MVENKGSLFGIIAIIIGASGLGLGAFSIVNFQVVEGPPGGDGQDGTDGQDAPIGLVVGILDPDQDDAVWGEIVIRALVYGSNNYSVSVKANQTEIGTQLPTFWNTSLEVEGWYNLTVLIMDNETKETASDTVWILIDSPVSSGVKDTYTLTRTGEQFYDGWYSGWQSVFDLHGGLSGIWVDVEEGDVLYLSFTGNFWEPTFPQYYSISFYDYGTGVIGVPVVEYLDDIYRSVTLDSYVFFMDPGLHRIDVCMYDPPVGQRNKDLYLTIQVLVL